VTFDESNVAEDFADNAVADMPTDELVPDAPDLGIADVPEPETLPADTTVDAELDTAQDNGTGDTMFDGTDTLGGDVVIRIMAANLTSGNGQDYDLGHGLRIIRGLAPDIVLINEFRYGSSTADDLQEFMNLAFGDGNSFMYYRGPGRLPNGVLSRYPIVASGSWDDQELVDREFDWARIDVPGPRDLWAVSVHLKAGNGSTEQARRLHQGMQLYDASTTPATGFLSSLPSDDYVVLGGDFNTYARDEACVTMLSGYLATQAPYPDDGASPANSDTNSGRSHPYDWVLADTDLDPLEVPVVIGERTFENGLVFDSRVYTPLSDVAPVQEGDSGADGIQHMAVIRDFWLP